MSPGCPDLRPSQRPPICCVFRQFLILERLNMETLLALLRFENYCIMPEPTIEGISGRYQLAGSGISQQDDPACARIFPYRLDFCVNSKCVVS